VATLAAGVGSNLWMTGSQALWQHGPAALALTSMLLAIGAPRPAPIGLGVGGIAAGCLVAVRLIDALLVVPVVIALAAKDRRGLLHFLPGVIVISGCAIAANVAWFGTPLGGQAELEALHPRLHAVEGPWSSEPWKGLAGTLVSPSRGLFVFSPWIPLAVALAPWSLDAIKRFTLLRWSLIGLLPYLALLSAYSVWWGGFCFGPRYWTDVMPLFAVLLACALMSPRGRRRAWRLILGAAIGWSVAVQALGAWCYPSSWNLVPANVDTHHGRLWDWSDTELSRCVSESIIRTLR
jgi:hypothetical protein